MSSNYKIASEWETDALSDADRTALKDFVTTLVGYPCKIACKNTGLSVDIYVYSEKKKRVIDWIEIQSTGALGVIYDNYKEGVSTDKLDAACEGYNTLSGVTFEDSSSESGSESDFYSEDDDDGRL